VGYVTKDSREPLVAAKCAIVGHRNQGSCGFRSIVGSYDGEVPCPNDAVERVHLMREGYDLDVCTEHLRLFPASTLDLDVGGSGA
jgi:hypothetical protein